MITKYVFIHTVSSALYEAGKRWGWTDGGTLIIDHGIARHADMLVTGIESSPLSTSNSDTLSFMMTLRHQYKITIAVGNVLPFHAIIHFHEKGQAYLHSGGYYFEDNGEHLSSEPFDEMQAYMENR